MGYKVGALILATSKNRDSWKMIQDTYLFNLTLKSFLLTHDKEHDYIFYIGIDKGDRIFDNETQQREITRFSKVYKNIEFKFVTIENIEKGHVTVMWNKLFDYAYAGGCDYFYQCGDDIQFKTNGWVNDSIRVMIENDNLGITGPKNNNNRILTQAFVSRKHMEIFGWFFPAEIKNWCCDDWYNMVYHPKYLFPLNNHLAENNGGQPRYDIDNNPNFTGGNNIRFSMNTKALREQTMKLATNHKLLIEAHLKKSK